MTYSNSRSEAEIPVLFQYFSLMSLSGSKKHLFTFYYVNEIYIARVCTTSMTQTRFFSGRTII